MVIRAMYLLLAVAVLNIAVQLFMRSNADRFVAKEAETAAHVRVVPEAGEQNPLTVRERSALKVAVQRCWHKPAALLDRTDMLVVMRVELDRHGKLAAPIGMKPMGDRDPAQAKIAFEAARRAFLRCQGGGYDLPDDKYEHWKRLDIGVNPEGVVAAWQAD